MKTKRLLALTCAAAVLLVSCVSGGNNPTPTEANAQTTGTEQTIEATEATTAADPLPDIPADADYGGHEITFLVRNEKHMIFVAKDIYAEKENSEPINDAVFKRNKAIEEKLNITISQFAVENPGTYIQKLVTSGDCPYEVMVEATGPSKGLIDKNMLVDLRTVPYIDFNKPWWDQSILKSSSLNNRVYYAVSDLIVSDKNGTWGIIFNKNIIKDEGLDDPYALVLNGDWTLDKFAEMCRSVSADVNGDGKYSVLDDKFGFGTEWYNDYVMAVGSGGSIAGKDENDLPILTLNTERMIAAATKAVAIATDRSAIRADKITDVSDPFYGGLIPAFNAGRILFYMGSIALVPQFRGMEQEFGILPIPKFDNEQKEYYTTMSVYNNGAIYIPVTNTDLERTGVILEALSAESRKTLLPAYYDLTLKTKLSRDNESKAMLDILFANRINDIGAIYNFGSLLDKCFSTYSENIVSVIDAASGKAAADIQKLVDKVTA